MSALYGLWRREDAADLQQYHRDIAKIELEQYGMDWWADTFPAEVVEALCWEDYAAEHYDDETLRVGADRYRAVRDALSQGADLADAYASGSWTRIRQDAVYQPAFEKQHTETAAALDVLDDYMTDIQAWRRVSEAWIGAAEESVERMYEINPFEAERRQQTVEILQHHHAGLDPYRLRKDRLTRIGGKAKWDRDMQMFGVVKAGIWGGIAAMVAGLPVVGAAIGVAGPGAAMVPARRRRAEQDAVGTIRADYRVAEMRDRLDNPLLTVRPA